MYHIWETNDVIQMREKWEGMIDGIFDLLWLYSDDKVPYSQRYVFPVVMYGCESWTIKKADEWIRKLWYVYTMEYYSAML